MGTLYGIGVGPGDPEYMTLKSVRLIEKCKVLVLPGASKDECYAYKIVKQVLPSIDEKVLLFLPFPMIKDKTELKKSHDRIYEIIEENLEKEDVAFLTIGDPSIYSTYNYIQERVLKSGKRAEMISGIPSFCAVAARLGIPLASNKEEIRIIPGSYQLDRWEEESFRTEEGTTSEKTCIYMKSGKRLKELIGYLEKESQNKQMEIYGVSNCGLSDEKVYRSLAQIKEAELEKYLTIIITKE